MKARLQRLAAILERGWTRLRNRARFRSTLARSERITRVLFVCFLLSLAVGALAAIRHDPYVTLTLQLDRVELQVRPPRDGVRDLLNPDLRLRGLTLSGVAVEPARTEKCAAPEPGQAAPGGIEIAGTPGKSFSVPLQIFEGVALNIEVVGRNQYWLQFNSLPGAEHPPFRATIAPGPEQRLPKPPGVALPQDWCPYAMNGEPLASDLEAVILAGKGAAPAVKVEPWFDSQRPVRLRAQRLDPLDLDTGEPHYFAEGWKALATDGGLVVLEAQLRQDRGLLHTRQPFPVDGVRLYSQIGAHDLPDNYLLRGRVEFWDRPDSPYELPKHTLLDVAASDGRGLSLQALLSEPEAIELVLTGNVAVLRAGPDLPAMRDLRPSLLDHYFGQQMVREIALAVLSMLAIVLAAWMQAGTSPSGR